MNNLNINFIENESFKTRNDVLKAISKKMAQDYNVDYDQLYDAFIKREDQSSTGFEKGIAIPHAKIKGLNESQVLIVRGLDVNWPSMDGKPTEVAISIIVGDGKGDEHLKILSSLSRRLINDDFLNIIKNGSTSEVKEAILSENEPNSKDDLQNSQENKGYIIGVTACTTGIAHTYMAAEALEEKAKELGYKVKIETRGQSGINNQLTDEDIKKADGVIVATDVEVPVNRFEGKKVVKVPVADGIKKPEELIKEINTAPEFVKTGKEEETSNEKISLYKSLLTGVTHMLPFVVVGGIFTALRFLFGTADDIQAGVEPLIEVLQLGQFFGDIGGILFGMMLPVLAGYIAYSIGNRAALMPGFLAGLMANNQGSGFLGAILGGFVAGFVARFLFSKMASIPKSLQGSYQILFLPILAALIIGIFMVIFGVPIGWLNTTLTNALVSLQDFSPILLGALIGAMMASDMGGPINKAAYVTGTLLLAEGNQIFMAAVMAGGMVPPLAIALSTVLYKNKYTKGEIDAGKTNWIMGLSFVTEGAIPFAAADPKRVIPSLMLGSAVASSLTMFFKVGLPAPHGGIFVFPLVDHVWLYILSIAIGTVVGAITLGILKKEVK